MFLQKPPKTTDNFCLFWYNTYSKRKSNFQCFKLKNVVNLFCGYYSMKIVVAERTVGARTLQDLTGGKGWGVCNNPGVVGRCLIAGPRQTKCERLGWSSSPARGGENSNYHCNAGPKPCPLRPRG